MSRTLTLYVVRLYLQTLLVAAGGVLTIFLVADFGDRLKAYLDRPLIDVAELYLHKTAVVFGQLMPAAMLLAAGIAITTLKRRGELDAMRALGISPARVVLPLLLCTVPMWAGLVLFDEKVASASGAQLDRLQRDKFNTWGDYRFFHAPQQWLRLGRDIFRVAGTEEDGLLRDVMVLRLGPDFTLQTRIDARAMRFVSGERWRFEDATVRDYTGTRAHLEHAEATELSFAGADPSAFALKGGRPEQMSLGTLAEQVRLRAAVGLPAVRYRLAMHGRFSYPALGVIGTLLAAALALRGGRRAQLTLALVEGLAVSASLWGLLVVGRALALGDRLPAVLASWGPAVVLLLAAGVALVRLQRRV